MFSCIQISLISFALSFNSDPAPNPPPPPSVTAGSVIDGFTISNLGPQDVVVEYVCNYTSVITGLTSQVRMKPSETADVPAEAGEYEVQVLSQ